ncbi:MAG TPA: hypothetical protein VF975_05585 [Thermoanaerobaculia bacterium]
MRVRTLLIATAVLSTIVGAVVAYLVLTVPNDLQAAALMKTARRQIAAGDHDHARESLSRIVQQYPRTDAAAAAMVALASIGENERHKMMADISALRTQSEAQQKQIVALSQRVDEIAARPIPQPAPPPPAPKKAPARRTTKRRHRR